MFVTKVLTSDYNSWTLSARGKNKAKTKPICFYPAPTTLLLWLFENLIMFMVLITVQRGKKSSPNYVQVDKMRIEAGKILEIEC
jgi:hypothetical protein